MLKAYLAKAAEPLNEGGYADYIWSCVKRHEGQQLARLLACCITAAVLGAISWAVRATKDGKAHCKRLNHFPSFKRSRKPIWLELHSRTQQRELPASRLTSGDQHT